MKEIMLVEGSQWGRIAAASPIEFSDDFAN
jgi:hypothetical protein